MKRIAIASDSFKGTFSSLEICELFKSELKDRKDIECLYFPIADGGEGSLDAVASAIKGRFVGIHVLSLDNRKIFTHFYMDENKNAYIEVASCCALNQNIFHKNPGDLHTFGLGMQINKAIKLGAKTIYMFLGGSGTNDGGGGLFAAIGTKFYDEHDELCVPTGNSLDKIVAIDNSKTLKRLKDVKIIGLCDVKNTYIGPNGASRIYGPQKGASKDDVIRLDENLRLFSEMFKRDVGVEFVDIPGSGAAGGIGGGLIAFGNAKLERGAPKILDLLDFKNKIEDVDYVITGEGKLDSQTFEGKTVSAVLDVAKDSNKKVILVVGVNEISKEECVLKCAKDIKIYETNPEHLDFESVKKHSKEMYIKAIKKLIEEL